MVKKANAANNAMQYNDEWAFERKVRIESTVGLIPKLPKELQLFYIGIKNFEQFRFQSN